MNKPIGMSQTIDLMQRLENEANNEMLHYDDRILALTELGLLQKDTHNMAKTLRRIQNLVKRN